MLQKRQFRFVRCPLNLLIAMFSLSHDQGAYKRILCVDHFVTAGQECILTGPRGTARILYVRRIEKLQQQNKTPDPLSTLSRVCGDQRILFPRSGCGFDPPAIQGSRILGRACFFKFRPRGRIDQPANCVPQTLFSPGEHNTSGPASTWLLDLEPFSSPARHPLRRIHQA